MATGPSGNTISIGNRIGGRRSAQNLTRRPASSKSRQPVSTQFISAGSVNPIGGPVRTSDDLTQFVKDRNNELTAARDNVAFEGLADGHTQGFLDYAESRIKLAQADDEKTFWTKLRDRAQQRVEDANLAAGVPSGDTTLEEVQQHLKDRLASMSPTSPDYGTYVTQLGQVKNGIIARDFRSELLQAQAKLSDDGDHKAYLKTLSGMLTRASDPAAQAALKDQITQVQTTIDKERMLVRAQEDNKTLGGYYDGSGQTSASEAIRYLSDRAASASSVSEANWYTNEIQKVNANEIALQRARLSAAAGAGGKVLRDALVETRQSFLDAYQDVADQIKGGNVPDKLSLEILQKAAATLSDSITAALPNANAMTIGTLRGYQREVETKLATANAQAGTKIADQAIKDAQAFTQQAAEEKAGDGDPELMSMLRARAVAKLQAAMSSPYVQGNTDLTGRLQAAIGTATTAQKKEIESERAVLSGDKLPPKYGAALNAAYESYKTRADETFGPGVADQPEAWLDAVHAAGNDPKALATALGFNPDDPTTGPANVKWASKVIGDVADAEGILTAAQQKAAQTLATLTADRDASGNIDKKAWTNDPNWQPGGALDESTRAARRPIATGQPGVTLPEEQQPGTDAVVASGAGGHMASPMGPADEQQQTPDDPWAAGGERDESTRAARRQDPYLAALDALDASPPLTLPDFTLPDLPPPPDFLPASSFDYSTLPDAPSLSVTDITDQTPLSPRMLGAGGGEQDPGMTMDAPTILA